MFQKMLQGGGGGGTSGNYVVKEEHFMLPLGTTIKIGVDYVPIYILVNFSTYSHAFEQSFYIKSWLDFTNNTTGVLKSSNNETLTISYSNNAISISFTGSSAEVWNSTQTEMLIMTNA